LAQTLMARPAEIQIRHWKHLRVGKTAAAPVNLRSKALIWFTV